MVCKLCPTRKHCWDKGNCDDCEYGMAFNKLNRKIKRLKAKNEALEKENEELKKQNNEPQKQNEGEWELEECQSGLFSIDQYFVCSACKQEFVVEGWDYEDLVANAKYCPNCGAKMKQN